MLVDELLRAAAAATVAAVAAVVVMRLLLRSAAARRRHDMRRVPAVQRPDMVHVLTGFALAVLLLPRDHAASVVVCAAGVVAFAVLAVKFAVTLYNEGITSRAGADRHGRHGGYNLHHLAACAAMTYLCATAGLARGTPGGPMAFDTDAAAAVHNVTSLTGLNWLLGMYFLIAATSLGFRVGEPTVRITHRVAVPAGAGGTVARMTSARPAAGLLTSRAGVSTSEVVMSAGLAFAFLA